MDFHIGTEIFYKRWPLSSIASVCVCYPRQEDVFWMSPTQWPWWFHCFWWWWWMKPIFKFRYLDYKWVPQEIEGSTHDKSIDNILCWNVHEKTNHSVLAHLWCVTERSWLSQLAKYITQRKQIMSWWEPQLCLFVCLPIYFDGLMLWNWTILFNLAISDIPDIQWAWFQRQSVGILIYFTPWR